MTDQIEVEVEAEDPSNLKEAETFATGLTPSDHLTDFRQQFEIQQLEHQLQQLSAELLQDADRHALRKYYSFALFVLVLVWVITVWVFVALQGLGAVPKFAHWKFRLSDAVLIAYITSTTASILGLFGIAAYWLFGKPKAEQKMKSPLSKTGEAKADKAKFSKKKKV